MKRLSRFEIESLVNVVMSKLNVIESEKVEKECSKRVDEWDKEMKELVSEKIKIEEKIREKSNKIYKEIREKGWKGISVNGGYSFNGKNVSIDENSLVDYNLRYKIIDEIVINNLKGNNVNMLIESLVDKFKS